MYRRIFLVACMVLFSVLHVASFDYDSYDYDCSFMRTATASAGGQIEMLVHRVQRYYDHHNKLPDTFAQLENEKLGGFEIYCWPFDEYYKSGAGLKKISNDIVEVTLSDLKTGSVYRSVYERDGDEHIITFFENTKFVSSTRYDRDGYALESLNESGKYVYEYSGSDGFKIMSLSSPKQVQEKYTLPSFIYSREEGLLSRKRKMIKFVSFAMCFVSLL